tara:strand:+ start:3218 stop:4384 length:1167 start_codon:yes stop_codon:yes gene_type:complete
MFKKVKIKIFKLLVFTFLFSVLFSNNFHKCVWIKSDSMRDKEAIENALIFAYEYGFDKVFLQVRYRGDAFYNSDIVSKHNSVDENFDPLAYALDLGHSLGLEVHAWVNTYILWSSNQAPYDLNHIYYSQPNWLESNIYGKSDASIDISLPQSHNWEGVYLSPNHPEVNKYLRSVFFELIENYDIDGLHLDYIRFQDDIYGYNDMGISIFKDQYGFNPLDIERNIISTKYGWSQFEIDSMKNTWKKFKIENINNLIHNVYSDIDSLNKKIELSAAVKADPILSEKKWSQDWESWIQKEIIDFVVVMNYSPDMINFNHNIESIKLQFNKNKFNKIIMGIAIYNQDFTSVSDKVYLSYLYNFKGISLFSYDNKKNDLIWFDRMLDIFEVID